MTLDGEDKNTWTVRSINIHGMFFERWCADTISGIKGWEIVSTNYPVEFPPLTVPYEARKATLIFELNSRETVILLRS